MTQVGNPLTDWINLFTYFPTTNWQHAFSPTINFGSNTQDRPVEQHVLDSVGSYGFQLNRVLDALAVIVDHPTLRGLSPEERQKIDALKELAQDADAATKEYQGEATETRVEKLIKDMGSLKQADTALYNKLKDQILKNL